ncbi:hypothetical protein AKJ51_03915, partial [candidate division MSBL1 archaeon SCGC-AAA382A20]
GPFGFGRPLAGTSFGGKDERVGVRVEENLLDTLENVFDLKPRKAARRTMTNGSVAVWPEEVEIGGAFGVIRPFAKEDVPELEDEEARGLLEKLSD